MENEGNIRADVNNDDDISNGSAHLLSKRMSIGRLRKYLLVLLSIMIAFSLFYLLFVSLPCMKYINSWYCEHFNRRYEFSWALVSLIYDTLWLIVTFRSHVKGLLFFAWLSTILLCIFGVFLIVALLAIFQTMLYFHMIETHIIVASVISVVLCIITLVLQLIIILFSFKLSKLISKSIEKVDDSL
ncbi:unnamed protein product [Adineta ricciae]|uniref:Uncharacterized protein n=1 Tax=Adineta ricciae TaxID=249248 RepID=A0A814AMB5_ADIRI|nr:unnamed protein product [Adineta ricciae]